MRFRDTLKFALELFVPEKLMHPGGSSASDPKPEASQNVATSLEAEEAVQRRKGPPDYRGAGPWPIWRSLVRSANDRVDVKGAGRCRGFLARAGIGSAASIDRRDDFEGGRRRRARSGPPEGRGDVRPGAGCRHCGRTATIGLTASAAEGTGRELLARHAPDRTG